MPVDSSLLIIAPLPSVSKRTRLNKLSRLATSKGYGVKHWGWSRVSSDIFEDLPFKLTEKRLILKTTISQVRLIYPLWSFLVFLNLVFRSRPQVVYCLGLETAVAAWAASFLRPTRYLFDDADRLLLIIRFPGPIAQIVRWLEIRVSRASLAHIVPGQERYDYQSDSIVVVKNTPTEEDLHASRNESIPEKPSAFVVYVNGWLGETRGLPILLESALTLSENTEISFVAAGRMDGAASKKFTSLPNVCYIGEVSGACSLALYKIADVVVTLYDPKIEINRFAESNKWGDAIATSTPVIVNSEVSTARFLVDSGAAIDIPYSDSSSLTKLLQSLHSHPNQVLDMKKRIRALATELKPFDRVMDEILERTL